MDANGSTEAPQATRAAPLLAYDGDCRLCRRTVRLLVLLRLVPRERLRPIADFEDSEGQLGRRLALAGAHDEMAAWDPERDEIRIGIDGLLWALEGAWIAPLLVLARPAFVRWPLRQLYRTVAYNRRVISPPPEGVRCACEPLYSARYAWALGVLGLGLYTLLAWILGRLVLGPAGERWILAPLFGGYAAAALPALTASGRKRTDRLGHLAVVGVMGMAILIPPALLGPLLPRVAWIALLSAALPLAFFVVDRAVDRRREGLGVTRRETVRWWLMALIGASVGVGMGFWLYP